MGFKRKKDYFVGIDSDGTVFDSMKLKHTHAFIPAMIRVWGLEECSELVYGIAERVNLYSQTRGINRFPGLLMTFEELKERQGNLFSVANLDDLRKFVQSDMAMSNVGLEEYRKKNPSEFLNQVLLWSKLGDDMFAKACENLEPFDSVKTVLKIIHEDCDCMVVSAASGQGLNKDWGRNGLLENVDFVAGQEFGGKASQLCIAKEQGYRAENCMMIGDGLGDLEAAKQNGFCFYPIFPGREEACWRKFLEVDYPHFMEGRYSGRYEEALCREFRECLGVVE